METLDAHVANHGIESEALLPYLKGGFPWHHPDLPHPELSHPETWWNRVETLLAGAYEGVGLDSDRANRLAGHAHRRFIDPRRGWRLFNDTLPVLTQLRSAGWTHAILSNHVPELGNLVDGLGLSPLIDVVYTSALTGFEKPHPEAFQLALEDNSHPEHVWMIGDNPIADVAGAEAMGIPAILVRNHADDAPRQADNLYEAGRIIEGRR
jgi:putative hydrolase of the HAD superfamily